MDAPDPAANGTGAAATRSYAYDLAGNRTAAAEADLIANTNSTTSYTTNNVNAYSNVGGTAFTYDPDGNMTRGLARNDGSLNGSLVPMNLTWDAHNRLKTAAPVTAAAGRLRGSYTYDAQGRRIHRLVEVFQGGTWVLQSQVRYSYDGWNMNYEVTVDAASQTTARRLTWGKDLSGSLQGAGGVGGLLMSETTTDGGTTWTPAYHLYDGNGNMSTVVDGGGAVLAAYTYDPYGRVAASSGSQAGSNVWRFSTKPVDTETGWSYYGYRYYSADLGRWTAKDPIGEKGGLLLFGFTKNNPVNDADRLGLDCLYTCVRPVPFLTWICVISWKTCPHGDACTASYIEYDEWATGPLGLLKYARWSCGTGPGGSGGVCGSPVPSDKLEERDAENQNDGGNFIASSL